MDAGTWADWVMAGLTGGGLGAAVYQLRAGRRDQAAAEARRRADDKAQQKAMARAVGIKVQWDQPEEATGKAKVEFELLNSSPYPISGVVVHLAADRVPY